ncbi:hypothetical protein CF326_g8071 [Tilletia indica]|nr:hypothetical protein CF326_g8071 [Tilletia indica]
MEVCTTLGMLTPQHAVQLKNAGLTAYNHNVDTSCEYYDKGGILRLGEKPIKDRSAFQVRPWRRPPTSGLPGVTDIIPTGAPPVTLPGGVLPTTGLPGVTDILPTTGLPIVTDILPTTGLPGIIDIIPTGFPSVTLPGGVLLTTGLPGVTDILPGTGLPGVTDVVPTGLSGATDILPITGLPGLTSLLPTATLPGVTEFPRKAGEGWLATLSRAYHSYRPTATARERLAEVEYG